MSNLAGHASISMANLHQQLVGARRALLILGWALVVAKVALAIETNVRAKLVVTLADRIAGNIRLLDEDAIAGQVNATNYIADQLIVRFREGVPVERCRDIMHTQGTPALCQLDAGRNLYLLQLPAPQTVPTAIDQFTVLAEVDYAVPNVYIQEVVRAYLHGVYPNLVTTVPHVVDGTIRPPEAPGLGTRLLPDLKARADATVRITSVA